MALVGIGWLYVTVMMAVAEATSTTGTVLGAFVTLVFYGLLPLAIVLYLLNTPARRRAQRAARLMALPAADEATPAETSMAGPIAPDQSSHAAGDTVAPEREKP
ncbi:MAG: hypothetical protein AD742_16810 [Methylibium sp. NZG]|nr:MAG: hypothetical protein AD742_16810 [Methylibium sp. NZG]